MKRFLKYLLPVVALILIFTPQLSHASNCTVTNSNDAGAGSLRNCIDNVATDDGDTVTIPAGTTVTLTSGQIQLLRDITIQGAGDGTSIIDGNAADRIFEIDDGTPVGASVVINGVTLQNGSSQYGGAIYIYNGALRLVDCVLGGNIAPDSGGNDYGGAVYNYYGSLVIENCTFSGNTANDRGGSIYVYAGSLTVVDSIFDGNATDGDGGVIYSTYGQVRIFGSTFTNNYAASEGGALYNYEATMHIAHSTIGGSASSDGNSASDKGGGLSNKAGLLIIENSTVSNNAVTGNNGSGGGIYADGGGVTIVDSIISENRADDGGGIYNYFGALYIDRSTFSQNHATDIGNDGHGEGGGLNNYSYYGGALVANSTFSGNTAALNGGGIYSYDSTLDIFNSTFSGNTADNSGGGIFNDYNYGINLNNVTIANNVADADSVGGGDGGGLYNDNASYEITFSNTIIANNSVAGPGTNPDCYSNFDDSDDYLISRGHNLIGVVSDDCDVFGDTSTDLTGDPGFDPAGLADNGGPTQTIALVSSSQALDAGDDSLCDNADQRGTARPQGPRCDIGAFEAGPSVALSSTEVVFPAQEIDTTSAPIDVTLKNKGAIALTINSIAITGDFAETNDCGDSLAAGATCTLSITCTPTVLGVVRGAITLDTSASVQLLTLLGAGISAGEAEAGPSADLSRSAVVFPEQELDTTSAPIDVTLTNNGTSALTINSIAITGDFAETNDCGDSLAVGATCTISITCTPTVAGVVQGAITFDTSASVQPLTLLGVGISGEEACDGGCSLSRGQVNPFATNDVLFLAVLIGAIYVFGLRKRGTQREKDTTS